MAYLGNTPTTQGFIPAIDYFSGNGATVAFTLSRPVASVAQVQATIENVPQNPGTAFTVSGNTITFDGAPPSGTNNIYVYYTSPITQVIQPGQGTVGTAQLASNVLTPTAISDQLNASTGYFDLPTGTTAQRPASPVNGMTRYNTTLNQFEVYENGVWTQYNTSYTIDYLVAAGGGGATGANGGGGGAGGYIAVDNVPVPKQTALSVVVGSGGTSAGSATSTRAGNGNNSSLIGGAISATSIGGGGGASFNNGSNFAGASGGSGGGGGGADSGQPGNSGGSGTAGQGNAGGAGSINNTLNAGGGGGGAGGAGSNATNPSTGGNGGVGINWKSLGTFYAGGGGGGSNGTGPGLGGNGGGGNGGGNNTNGTAGTANRGGGGGAGGSTSSGGNGGSGVVIIRYAGDQKGTGGTVTSAGGFTYHTFTTSGTFTA
jgi:hypothetical protein